MRVLSEIALLMLMNKTNLITQKQFAEILDVTDVVGKAKMLTTATDCPILLLLSDIVIVTEPAPTVLAAVYVTTTLPDAAPAAAFVLMTAVPPVAVSVDDL